MADSKRSSLNAKIATPRSAGSSSPAPKDAAEALSRAIGAKVKIVTSSPSSQTLEGLLFTADPIFGLIALDTKSTNGSATATNGVSTSGDYHLVPISNIQSYQIQSPATDLTHLAQPLPPVNIKRANERLEARVNTLKEQEASRGKGVTREAQAIFDALKRVNIPIRWHDKQMIAHEAVIITPPYRPEDCKGSKDKQQVVNQVKKVLEGERRKLREREDREKSDAGQRKGG